LNGPGNLKQSVSLFYLNTNKLIGLNIVTDMPVGLTNNSVY